MRCARPLTFGAVLLSTFGAQAAGTTASEGALPEMIPSPLGHYLASRHAQAAGDVGAAAVLLGYALAADPSNVQLLQTGFTLMVSEGRMSDALAFAKRLEAAGVLGGVARVDLALARAKAGDFSGADGYLAGIEGEGLERFLKPMLRSWTQLEIGGVEAAQRTLSPVG